MLKVPKIALVVIGMTALFQAQAAQALTDEEASALYDAGHQGNKEAALEATQYYLNKGDIKKGFAFIKDPDNRNVQEFHNLLLELQKNPPKLSAIQQWKLREQVEVYLKLDSQNRGALANSTSESLTLFNTLDQLSSAIPHSGEAPRACPINSDTPHSATSFQPNNSPYFKKKIKGQCNSPDQKDYYSFSETITPEGMEMEDSLRELINTKLKKDPLLFSQCIHSSIFLRMSKFYENNKNRFGSLGPISPVSLMHILSIIEHRKDHLQALAKVTKKVTSLNCSSSLLDGECKITFQPDGGIFLDYRSDELGKGSYKTVRTHLSLGRNPMTSLNGISDKRNTFKFRALASVHSPEGVDDIKKELQIMKKISNNGSTEGILIGTENIQENGQKAMSLPMMDGDVFHKIYSYSVPLHDKLNYLEKSAKGLANLHKSNIAHLDFKPENILDRTTTKKGIPILEKVAIADFGLAEDLTEWRKEHPYQAFDMIGGTLGFMPWDAFYNEADPKMPPLPSDIKDRDKRILSRDVFAEGLLLEGALLNWTDPLQYRLEICQQDPACIRKETLDRYNEVQEKIKKGEYGKETPLHQLYSDTLKDNIDERPTSLEFYTRLKSIITNNVTP